MKRISAETTIEDLIENPAAYGVPTFEQFKQNRDRWLGRDDDAMASLVDGPTMFRKDLVKMKFKVRGVDVGTPEQVETMLGDFGYSVSDIHEAMTCAARNRKPSVAPRLRLKMDMIPLGAGKYDVVVDFLP